MENNNDKTGELDITQLVRAVWDRRWLVAKVAGTVVALGFFLAIFGEVKYTASAVMVPQTGKSFSGGNLQGFAAIAGINLAAAEHGTELLSPIIYPMVVRSVPFQKDLMYTGITIEGHEGPVTLLTYFTESGYRKFSLFPFIKKYIVGLPGLALGAIRGNDHSAPIDSVPEGITSLSLKEFECMEMLSKRIAVRVDEENGYISLSATMPRATMAAQVAARAQELLQDYITRFKLQKAQANLDFIEERYREVKADFEAKQRALAIFQDANRDISSAVARTRENSLSNEYELAFSIYSEMARQREQAEIKVKEDTPVFTVVEPVTVPVKKSAPRRVMTVAVALFLGLLAGVGSALIMPWAAEVFDVGGSKERPKKKSKE